MTSRWLRRLFLSLAAFTLVLLGASSVGPDSISRDFAVDYLAARALRDGIDPYKPLVELSLRYFQASGASLVHPTPHPPVLFVLSLPLSLLPFSIVFPMILTLNVLLLLVVGRWLGLSTVESLALTAWPPVWWVLFEGQVELLILVAAMLGWRAAERGQEWRAGLFLGLAGIPKLHPILLLVPFVARRRVRVLVAAGGVLGLAQVVNLLVLGPAGLVRYYAEIIPQVTGSYIETAINIAPYGALLRIFGATRVVEPMVEAPALAAPAAALVSAFGVFALLRLHPRGAPLASLLTLPAAWTVHMVLALPEIVRLLRLPGWRTWALAAAAAASLVQGPVVYFANEGLVALMGWTGDRAPPVSGFVASIQAIGLVALLALSLRTSGRAASDSGEALADAPTQRTFLGKRR